MVLPYKSYPKPQAQRPSRNEVLDEVRRLYPQVDLKNRSSTPESNDALDVAIIGLIECCRIDEGSVQDILQCGASTVRDAIAHFERDKSSDGMYGLKVRRLLRAFGNEPESPKAPVQPETRPISEACPAPEPIPDTLPLLPKDRVEAAVYECFRMDLRSLRDNRLSAFEFNVRDAYIVLLISLTNMTVDEIAYRFQTSEEFVRGAQLRLRRKMPLDSRTPEHEIFRGRLRDTCKFLGVSARAILLAIYDSA